jgi:hypothetical protein
MFKDLKPYTLAGFEPRIFCSVGGRDEHYSAGSFISRLRDGHSFQYLLCTMMQSIQSVEFESIFLSYHLVAWRDSISRSLTPHTVTIPLDRQGYNLKVFKSQMEQKKWEFLDNAKTFACSEQLVVLAHHEKVPPLSFKIRLKVLVYVGGEIL